MTCYQDVELPKTRLQETRQFGNALRIGDLRLMENDIGEPCICELLDGGCAPLLVPGCQDDGDAIAGQLPAHLQPDPFVPAGNNSNPTKVYDSTACYFSKKEPGLLTPIFFKKLPVLKFNLCIDYTRERRMART